MKTLLTLLLIGFSFGASAQRSYVQKEIDDNGKRLRIRVDAEKDGRSVRYRRDFDSSGMSQDEKDELVGRIMDSLGVADARPARRAVSVAARGTVRNGSATVAGDTDERVAVRVRETGSRTPRAEAPVTYASSREGMEQVAGRVPYQKLVREDRENGRLWMHFEYKIDGEDRVFERTINTEGRTERDKKRLVEETERSLGLGIHQ